VQGKDGQSEPEKWGVSAMRMSFTSKNFNCNHAHDLFCHQNLNQKDFADPCSWVTEASYG